MTVLQSPAGPVVRLVLPFPWVTGNHSIRRAGKQYYRTREYREYQRVVGLRVLAEGIRFFGNGPVAIYWHVKPPSNHRRDWDNVRKVVLDSLIRAGVFADDRWQVIPEEHVYWQSPDKTDSKIVLEIRQMETR